MENNYSPVDMFGRPFEPIDKVMNSNPIFPITDYHVKYLDKMIIYEYQFESANEVLTRVIDDFLIDGIHYCDGINCLDISPLNRFIIPYFYDDDPTKTDFTAQMVEELRKDFFYNPDKNKIRAPVGRILRIKDLIWTCVFPMENYVSLGQLVKLIHSSLDYATLGVVWSIELFDIKKHTNLNPYHVQDISQDLKKACIINVAVLGNTNNSSTIGTVGEHVYNVGKGLKIRCGYSLLGDSFYALDVLIKEDLRDTSFLSLEDRVLFDSYIVNRKAPGIVDRVPVHSPCFTGIPAIDCFLPIGKGQRQLILGDYGAGKTTLSITILINQRRENFRNDKSWVNISKKENKSVYFIPCVYISVGKKKSEIARLKKVLEKRDALKYTCIVYSSADDTSTSQSYLPAAGNSVAEWFQNRGHDPVVVFDDLGENAVAFREISLLIRRPPGREAFPGDIFYLHSRLLERASQLKAGLGGGGLTSLPIVETKLGDITAYIPTNVISICDGQIILDRNLFIRINLKKSVSRVGAAAQPIIYSEIAKDVRKVFSTFNNYKSVYEMKGDLHIFFKTLVLRGYRMEHFMKLSPYETISLFFQIIIFFMLTQNVFDGFKVEHSKVFFSLVKHDEFGIKNARAYVSHFSYSESIMDSMFLCIPLSLIKMDLIKYCNDLRIGFKLVELMMNDNPVLAKKMKAAAESNFVSEVSFLANPFEGYIAALNLI